MQVEREFRGWCFRFTKVPHYWQSTFVRSMVRVEFKSITDGQYKNYNTFGSVREAFIAINRSLDMASGERY